MKRQLLVRPAAERELLRMGNPDASRIIHSLETLADGGRGDVRALKGAFKGQFRLRVGKWRVFFRFDAPDVLTVLGIDNRGEAHQAQGIQASWLTF